jgi:CBS domain-containing protein
MKQVKDFMIRRVISINQEQNSLDATKLIAKEGIGLLPVTDDEMNLVGVVSERDIIRKVFVKQKDPKETRIKRIMTKEIISATPSQGILEILKTMDKKRIKKVPVIKNKKLVGLICMRHILKKIMKR